jgi:hypothetical protein
MCPFAYICANCLLRNAWSGVWVASLPLAAGPPRRLQQPCWAGVAPGHQRGGEGPAAGCACGPSLGAAGGAGPPLGAPEPALNRTRCWRTNSREQQEVLRSEVDVTAAIELFRSGGGTPLVLIVSWCGPFLLQAERWEEWVGGWSWEGL